MFSLYRPYEVGSLCLLAALVRGLLMAVLADSSVVLGILATPQIRFHYVSAGITVLSSMESILLRPKIPQFFRFYTYIEMTNR